MWAASFRAPDWGANEWGLGTEDWSMGWDDVYEPAGLTRWHMFSCGDWDVWLY